MANREVPVLVVGGSLVGMTTAALLGHHGVRSLVVERHPGAAIHPRAALLLQRSMEILRLLEIEDRVVDASRRQFDPDGAIMSCETLAGKEIAYHMPKINEGVRDLSPSERTFVTQIGLEPLLCERATELGAEPLFNTELVSYEQDADGVDAVIRDRASGEEQTVRAQYMIAADGPHSRVRDGLGIAMSGRGVFSHAITIYFRADVNELLRGRNLSVIMCMNPVFRGFFRFEKPYHSGFLVVHTLGDPDDPATNVWDLDGEQQLEMIRAGLGGDCGPIEIDDVMKWEARADVAERMRDGRVLLIGDAAHVMPPYGGYGGNVGIHDAHNLAWKLALVLDGTAAPELLDSYEPERLPVARFTVEQAYTRYVGRAAPNLAAGGVEPVVSDNDVDLGYRYRSGAVLAEPDDDDGALHYDPREVGGRPGTRAPHVMIDGTSSIDLFGRRFVVLTDSEAWRTAAASSPVDVHPLGGNAGALGVEGSGALLVRPDGVVAWRAATDADASAEAFAGTLATLLGRREAAAPA